MSIDKPYRNERAERYVEALRKASNNLGKLAALRRGLASSTVVDAWPVVAALGGEIGHPGEAPHVDIAALYATHPKESNARNFGETCRQIALKASADAKLPESIERRFRRLIACDSGEELVGHLRAWIRLAAANDVGVNYESLLNDLTRWARNAAEIRVHWARAFWLSSVSASADQTEPQPV